MPSKRIPKPGAYTRISFDSETDEHGVEDQLRICRNLAKRLGLPEPAIYSDNDVGASTRTGNKPRPDYQRLLADVRAGAINIILSYSNSRLTRRPLELEDLIALREETERLYGKENALEIRTEVSGDDDLSTADGRMVARIKASVDAAESEKIAERQQKTYRSRALEGKPKLQRQRPFGWEKDGITIREDEAKWIRHGLARVLQGASITTVAREFEAGGVLTAAGRTHWGRTATLNVVLGWRTAGVRTYRETNENGSRIDTPLEVDGELVRGIWEPIITLEEREQALAMLKRHSRTQKQQGSWILSGLLRCGECSKAVYGVVASNGRRARYGCTNSHNTIPANDLEEYVLEMLRRHHKAQWKKREKKRPTPEPWGGQARLKEVQEKINELMDAYNSSKLPATIVFGQVEKLEEELKQLKAEHREYLANIAQPEEPPVDSAHIISWLFQNEGMTLHRTPAPGEVSPATAKVLSLRYWQPDSQKIEPVLGLDYDEGEPAPTQPAVSAERLNEVLKFYIERVIIKKAQGEHHKLTLPERVEIMWKD